MWEVEVRSGRLGGEGENGSEEEGGDLQGV